MTRQQKTKIVIISCVGLLALLLGMFIATQRFHPRTLVLPDSVLQQPRPLQSFELVNHNGKAFTQDDLLGQWTFLFFGFTQCPMICPTTLAELDKIYKMITTLNIAAIKPQVVFISVDPKRDTLERLNEYVPAFNPAFLGVTGTPEQLSPLTQQLGILAMQVPNPADPGEYTVDHSGSILLIDPQGQFYALFSRPFNAQDIVQDYLSIQEAHGKI